MRPVIVSQGPDTGPVASPSSAANRTILFRRAAMVVVLWLALAVAAAGSDLFLLAPPLIPALIVTSIAISVVTWRRSAALRNWTRALDLRVLIYFHVIRAAFGTLFLIELAAGKLPATFAERAGYGDVVAGVLALVAGLAVGRPRAATQPTTARGRALAWIFTIVGLADILLVLATAQVGILVDRDPLLLGAITRLPYALLPTVVVPLVILSHLLVLQRLRARIGAAVN